MVGHSKNNIEFDKSGGWVGGLSTCLRALIEAGEERRGWRRGDVRGYAEYHVPNHRICDMHAMLRPRFAMLLLTGGRIAC